MLTITTNVASLNTQRSLAKNTNALASTFERLSTGLRINSAKDDAAGLAISERFTSQIRGLNQATRNANDAISLARTAENALSNTTQNLQRIRELAVQAANDTNTASDRAALQEEVDQLLEEIDRIAVQSNFNERNLLDGSYTNAIFQVGAFASETIQVSIRSARVFNLGNQAVTTSTTVTGTALQASDVTLNGIAVPATQAQDDTLSTAGNDASAIAKAAAVNSTTAQTGVAAEVDDNIINLGAVTADTFAIGDFSINGVDIGAQTVLANDSNNALRNAINAHSSTTGVQATLDATNNLILTAADGRNVVIGGANPQGAGGAMFAANPAGTSYSTITLSSDDDFTIAGNNVARAGLTAGPVTVNTAVNVTDANITTQTGASDTISLMDVAIRQVSDEQARLGAILNRLDAAVSSLSSTSENISAARSRVRDADFAAETAMFSKNQILQQASTAMLAQANVSGQIALTLLGG
ncbi:MAG: flagellin [Myxococcota bacterium]